MLTRNVHGGLYVLVLIVSFVVGFAASVSAIEALGLRGCASTFVLFGGTTLLGAIPPFVYRRLVPAACARSGCPGRTFMTHPGKRLVYTCGSCGDSARW